MSRKDARRAIYQEELQEIQGGVGGKVTANNKMYVQGRKVAGAASKEASSVVDSKKEARSYII